MPGGEDKEMAAVLKIQCCFRARQAQKQFGQMQQLAYEAGTLDDSSWYKKKQDTGFLKDIMSGAKKAKEGKDAGEEKEPSV